MVAFFMVMWNIVFLLLPIWIFLFMRLLVPKLENQLPTCSLIESHNLGENDGNWNADIFY